jgi:glucokinase
VTQSVIALDIGGTAIKAAVVLPDGRVRQAERHSTRASDGTAAVLAAIVEIAAALTAKARADGLTPVAAGLAVPGVVDEAAGIAAWSANLGFRDVPLRDLVAANLRLPTALGHDVRAGGLAEARLGAARDRRHVLFVAIGTGIAAASIVGGRGYAGAHGAAGELGHVVVRPGGPLCRCGQRGCLEAVASASAVARRYAALTGTPSTAADVVVAYGDGDPVAGQVWRETVEALADGLATAQALFDAEVVVVGGGLAESGDALLMPLRRTLRDRLTFHREPRLVAAALGDEAGCLGAALLALDLVGAR